VDGWIERKTTDYIVRNLFRTSQ